MICVIVVLPAGTGGTGCGTNGSEPGSGIGFGTMTGDAAGGRVMNCNAPGGGTMTGEAATMTGDAAGGCIINCLAGGGGTMIGGAPDGGAMSGIAPGGRIATGSALGQGIIDDGAAPGGNKGASRKCSLLFGSGRGGPCCTSGRL